MLGFQTYVFPNIQGFLKYEYNMVWGRRYPRKNEILECQEGHLRQFYSQILAYSLFFKMLLFTIHYITLLFIKKFIHYSLGPHYSLIIKFFTHYSLSLKILGHYSLIIIPHPDPHEPASVRRPSTISKIFFSETAWPQILYEASIGRGKQCAGLG